MVPKDMQLKPGPGNYNIPETKNIRTFKIGERINTINKILTPGPGNYDPNPNIVKDSTRNVKIVSANKSQLLSQSKSAMALPGPG
jgi:hypothetical protein